MATNKFIPGLNYWNQIQKYHTSRQTAYELFGYNGPEYAFLGLGFELEFDTLRPVSSDDYRERLAEILITNNTKDEYFVEHDSSLRFGCELITQPHTIEALRDFLNTDIRYLLKEISEKTETKNHALNSALHIHISKGVFGSTPEEQQENVAKLWYLFSQEEYLIKKIGNRRIFRKCRFPEIKHTQKTAREVTQAHWNSKNRRDRYWAINCRNEPTIEIRAIASTTDYDELVALIEFYWFLANKSKNIPWSAAGNIASWIEDMPLACREYINTKIHTFNLN